MSKQNSKPKGLPSMEDLEENFMEETVDNNNPVSEKEQDIEEEEDIHPPHTTRAMKPTMVAGEVYEGTTVRVKREDGVYKKRIPVEVQGLSSQMLPPITKKKIAVYEVIGKDQIDPLTKQPIQAPPLILPGKFVVFDPFNKNVLARYTLLKNVSRSERVVRDGKDMTEEVVEDIVFVDGFKSVAIDRNYLEHVLLELHPLNESNKFRDKNQAAAFRRIDVGKRKDWSETTAGMDLAFEAETAVVNMRKSENIIAYATAAGIPTAGRMLDAGDNSVKTDLRKFARQNPRDFFKLNRNQHMAVKMSVLEAIEIGIIEYEVDKRQWVFSTDGDLVCQHLPGDEPVEAMVKMLQNSQYINQYNKMLEQLNYWD